MINEAFYFSITIRNYVKSKHLKLIHLFFSKVTQSFALLVFMLTASFSGFRDAYKSPTGIPSTLQVIAMYTIVIAVLLEYVFLMIGIVLIIVAVI